MSWVYLETRAVAPFSEQFLQVDTSVAPVKRGHLGYLVSSPWSVMPRSISRLFFSYFNEACNADDNTQSEFVNKVCWMRSNFTCDLHITKSIKGWPKEVVSNLSYGGFTIPSWYFKLKLSKVTLSKISSFIKIPIWAIHVCKMKYREIGPRISNLLRPKYIPFISNHCYHGWLYFHFLVLLSCAKYEYNNID